MPDRRRAFLILAVLVLLALASFWAALAAGSIPVAAADVFALLGQDAPGADIVRQLRLPRALAGFACGGLLALAGALMQVLLRNPLADPYILGISGGAGAGALFAIMVGMPTLGIDGLAFAGALGAMFLVFGLRGMLFWLTGDLGQAASAWPPMLALAIALVLAMPFARELNLLARGLLQAQALGVAVNRLRYAVFLLASLATAASVTTAGSIGFIGLVVPHLVRLVTGNDQRLLLPASALAGGALLMLADTLARSLIAPQQLPVGVLTALIGVPVFLFLLSRQPK